MDFIDLKAQYKTIRKKINKNIQQVLDDANFIMGQSVEEFEIKLAEYIGVKYAIGCGSGTDALQLIYMAYGIGAGDAVFCPDMTFVASVEPAYMLGAIPIFCDINKNTYNICTDSLERQIHTVIKQGRLRPRAIVAVDFVGNPADYDKLEKIAAEYNLLLIEDAAQGIGASYKGKKCGSFGNIAATSFFPSKPLGCYGDGGAVFTDDIDLYSILCSLRVHGKGSSKYDNVRVGINSRLDTIQAAILLIKLSVLEDEISKRQKIASKYSMALKDKYVVPCIEKGAISAYAQYTLLAEERKQRDGVCEYLKSKGVPTLVYYPRPMHTMEVFKYCHTGEEDFVNTMGYAERTFSIPFSAYLSEEDQEKIIESLLNF